MDPNDRYGLMGLLNVIRMTDPNMTTLARTDLTMLGLNLNLRTVVHDVAALADGWRAKARIRVAIRLL